VSADNRSLGERLGITESGSARVERIFKEFLDAADLVRREERLLPCLVLTYTTIDALASLERPVGKKDSNNADFISWVDKRIAPVTQLGCTAADLYGARCGVVHTFGPRSSWSEQGKARKVAYAWGPADVGKLERVVARSPDANSTVVVRLDDLLRTVRIGYGALLVEVRSDPTRRQIVEGRAAHLFAAATIEAVDAAL
jgi:hypothetical protein